MKLKQKILSRNYGGGGGGGTKTNSTIPEWAEPYIKNVGNEAERIYQSGNLSGVAGLNTNQQAAFGGGAEMISKAGVTGSSTLGDQRGRLTEAAKSGGYDPQGVVDAAVLEGEMRTAELGKQYGANGTLGSGRQAVQQGAQNAATAAAVAKIRQDAAQTNFQNKMTAEDRVTGNVGADAQLAAGTASGLANLGNQQRQATQQQLDSPYQALTRYATTIYGNPARQQTVATSGGK